MKIKHNYRRNKERAITRDSTPTMTDQAGARDTDINIIVGQFLTTGRVPGSAKEPIYEDFSQLPKDLRGFIEMGRALDTHRKELPEQLRGIPVERLVGLTRNEINAILAPKKEEGKEVTQ